MSKTVIVCEVLGIVAVGLGILGYLKRDIVKKGYEYLKDKFEDSIVNYNEVELDDY